MPNIDPEFRVAYANILNMTSGLGVPLSFEMVTLLHGDTSEKIGIRHDIVKAIASAQVGTTPAIQLREDASLCLFINLYALVFLPAVLANRSEQLQEWSKHLESDVKKILSAALKVAVDTPEQLQGEEKDEGGPLAEQSSDYDSSLKAYKIRQLRPLTARAILAGLIVAYPVLAISKGWLNPKSEVSQ